jgi:ADP-heptose:LPS heptosyltransferase
MAARNHDRIFFFGREQFVPTPRGKLFRCVPAEAGKIGSDAPARYKNEFSGLSEDSIYVGMGEEVADFDNEVKKRLPARPKALFIRDNGAGDVIMSTAAVRAVRRRLPDAKFVYATLPRHIGLLEGNEDVDEVCSVHDLNLESGGYDLIVNWARAVEDYSIPRNRGHRIDSFARMIGIELDDRSTFLKLSDADREFARRFLERKGKKFIGYVVQAASWNRTWPVWRAPELLGEFAARMPDYKIVLIDSQADAGYDAPNSVDACGRTESFKQAAALLERCELAIAQDTGLAHACGALGIPALALAGSIPPELRYGYYENFRWIHHAGRTGCCPCWDWQAKWPRRLRDKYGVYKTCKWEAAPKCLEAITPQEIVDAVEMMLKTGVKK